jgi:hypothetical protein
MMHPFVPPGRRWLLIRHLLTTVITILAVMATWMVLTAPFMAVLLIDDAFTYSGYAEAVLWVGTCPWRPWRSRPSSCS